MYKYPKKIAAFFFLTLLAFGLQALFFPQLLLLPFASFLAACAIIHPLPFSLWHSLIAGLMMDATTTVFPLGTHALIYFIVTLTLFSLRQFFYSDKAFSFLIYSSLFSFSITLFQFIFSRIMENFVTFSLSAIFSNFIIMPFLDGLYGVLWLYFPYRLYLFSKRYFTHG